jgi:L-Ala-D/L-Glu epimerase
MRTLTSQRVSWPLHRPFRIARGTMTQVDCIQVRLSEPGGAVGIGEAVGVDYAGETLASMQEQVESLRGELEQGL